MVDTVAAKRAVQDFLAAFDIDIEKRPGMEDTPRRVVAMYMEAWQGEQFANVEIAEMFGQTFKADSNDMVIVKDIEAFSWCEHHLALIYDMRISVGYLPPGRVIGLSKIARIADMVCRRLQLQERIGAEIADVLGMVLGSDDICVRVEACHSCMTARGIKKPGAKTVSFTRKGVFKNPDRFQEFLAALQ